MARRAAFDANFNVIDNNTYSIDLSSSWTNETVALHSIEKTAPVMKEEGLWADNNSFYAYGGSNGGPGAKYAIPPNALWQFLPDGNAGTWSEVSTAQSNNFTSLSRTLDSGFTSGNGLGFALGGILSETSAAYDDHGNIPIPGMVVYNISLQVWNNVSASGYGSGTFYEGAAHFVPSFGPEGLAVFIAGAEPGVFGGTANGGTDTILTFAVVTMFEPLSAQWKQLPVTGTYPLPSTQPCVAGAQGDNGTYEVGCSSHWS